MKDYPETNNNQAQLIVVVAGWPIDDEDVERLFDEELAESDISRLRSFDDNVKTIAIVPGCDNIDELKEYWTAVINEILHPCCNLEESEWPEFYVRTLDEFVASDRELNGGTGIYEEYYYDLI